MPRRIIKKYMPNPKVVRKHKFIKLFGSLLHDANLWHLNRRSVSGAFAVGLFAAFIPVPAQMLLAAAIAIVVRVNLPIAVGLVWITNPVTIPFILFLAFKIGNLFTGSPVTPTELEFTFESLQNGLGDVWVPVLIGCIILAIGCAITGYLLIHLVWRIKVIQAWNERRAKKERKNS